jgi:antitoxin component YwqK of YwqJK toxin-antitoxin module
MKSILFALLLLLVPKLCISQLSANDKKIYLDSTWNETSQENSKYYRIVKDYYLDQKEYKVLVYYKNNQLKEESILNGKDGGAPNGEKLNYYENGNKQSFTAYVNGRPTGKSMSWYENGNKREEGEYTGNYEIPGKHYRLIQYWDENNNHLIENGNGFYSCGDKASFLETGSYKDGYKDGVFEGKDFKLNAFYKEKYENGKFISGTRVFSDGTKTDYFEMEKRPFPKKGMQDFYTFIGKNFNYTNESFKNKVHGKIILNFVIDKEGQIVEPKILKGLGYGLDEEAVRVLLKYGDWIPGEQRGMKVRCSFSLPLTLQAVR